MKGQELIRVHLECVTVAKLLSSKNTLATIKNLPDDMRLNCGHTKNIISHEKNVEQIMKPIQDVAYCRCTNKPDLRGFNIICRILVSLDKHSIPKSCEPLWAFLHSYETEGKKKNLL